jgi:protein involved in polysaccharide export with SLBB domain
MKKITTLFLFLLFFIPNYSFSQDSFNINGILNNQNSSNNTDSTDYLKKNTQYLETQQSNLESNKFSQNYMDLSNFKDQNLPFKSDDTLKPEELSSFENFVSSGLKQFGYDFFYRKSNSFTPDQNISVPPDYVLGPGDELIITTWGRINERWVVSVSREGNIYIPKVGLVNVSGVYFKDLNDFIKKEISRYYTDFEINVSMGRLKSIRVYLVGNVSKPGAYTISGLSTIISALFDTGGPSKNGTMRSIELKRMGKTISTLDLYDFLLKGDKTKDSKLINDDVIYVPPVGPLVAINSGVKNPAIYEIKNGDKLLDLIKMADGFTNIAYNKRISVKRIFNNQYSDYADFNISELDTNSEKNIELKDGDIITIKSVIDLDTSINISGAVAYPGKIGLKQGEMSLRDAINLAGGLLSQAGDTVEITRFTITSTGVVTNRFEMNLKKVLYGDPEQNIKLMPYDSIVVKTLPDWYYPKYVEISGEIQSPGLYSIEKGERISSLLKRANGFTKNAFPKGIIFIRDSARKQQQENIAKIVDRLEKELFSEASNKISTSLSPEEVQATKEISLQKQKLISKLREVKATGRVFLKFKSIESFENSEYDIELQEGDKIIIPQRPDYVNVTGSVMAEGSYIYSGGGYKKYIDMAGGYSYYSDKSRVFIIKADGSAIRAKSGIFGSTKIEPGDTIVVPEKFEKIPWLRDIRDITQIMTNLLMSAGVLIKVF